MISNFGSGHIRKYFIDYKNIDEFEAQVNENMAAYEAKEKEQIERKKAMAGVPDEDGFITVVTKKATFFEDEVERIEGDEDGINMEGKRVLSNFYRISAKKLRSQRIYIFVLHFIYLSSLELEELKNKFEEDKLKLDELKRSKIFNPLHM